MLRKLFICMILLLPPVAQATHRMEGGIAWEYQSRESHRNGHGGAGSDLVRPDVWDRPAIAGIPAAIPLCHISQTAVSPDCHQQAEGPASTATPLLGLPGVEAPLLHCTSVLANGDVTISWTPPADTASSFDRYEIWSATSAAGPYVRIGTETNYNATTFIHIGANAHLESRFYFMKTVSGCGGGYVSEPSDTLRTMFLKVTDGGGIAELSWNPVSIPLQGYLTGWYNIYMEYPAGTWTLMDSTPEGTENYSHIVAVCDHILNFRVEVLHATGCLSISNRAGDAFHDVTAPLVPVIHYVSVDTFNSSIHIVWEESPSGDTQGYIIMHRINGQWIPIDTLYGIGNTSYNDLNVNAKEGSYGYGILAFDSCWSGTPPSPNTSTLGTTHESMFLESSLNVCERFILLSWNKYSDAAIDHYEVYTLSDGASVLLGTTDPDTPTFIHSDVMSGVHYEYVVKAVFDSAGFASLSNKTSMHAHHPVDPAFNYLQAASVEGENEVEIRVMADLAAPVRYYAVERAVALTGPYDEVGRILPDLTNPHIYTDLTAKTGQESYYYRIAVIDSCGDTARVSNVGSTILLQANANHDALVNIVSWSSYQGWDGNVVGYRLYRSIDGVYDPDPIAVMPPHIRVFEDHVEGLLQQAKGKFCYYVEAIESIHGFGGGETAFSNADAVVQQPRLWIPDAIVVGGGFNETFKPVMGYIDYSSYNFYIYNRRGQMIFHTDNIHHGWDGTYKSKPVAAGVYAYYFHFKGADGQAADRRGAVTVLYSDDP